MNKHKLRIYSRERITDQKGRRFEEKKKGPGKAPWKATLWPAWEPLPEEGE